METTLAVYLSRGQAITSRIQSILAKIIGSGAQLAPGLAAIAFLLAGNAPPVQAQGDAIQAKHVRRITTELRSPVRLAIDANQVVYVTDPLAGRVARYDTSGAFLSTFLTPAPLAIASPENDLLVLGNSHTGEVNLVDANGTIVLQLAADSTRFLLPSSAVVDDQGRIYLVDSKAKVVRRFEVDGQELSPFGHGYLVFPTAIVFDRNNQRLLVCESGGLQVANDQGSRKLIHAFSLDGTWLADFGDFGLGEGRFTRIQGIAVDQLSRIYVVDSFQARISVLDEAGRFLAFIGEFGDQPGQFKLPMDIAIDASNRLWVTSMNTNSIEVFQIGDIPTAVTSDPPPSIPTSSALLQNYPNPFNAGTLIPFILEETAEVKINIYNETGKLVRRFELGRRKAGNYTAAGQAVFWDGRNNQGEFVASGVYLYSIVTKAYTATRPMIFLK